MINLTPWQYLQTESVTLSGEFSCRLTDDERNEWFAFTRGSAQLAALLARRREFECATGSEEIDRCVNRYLDAISAMHDVAAEWYAGVKARREAACKAATTGGAS